MRWIATIVLGLALSACGGAQEVSQRVQNTPAQVMAPLLDASAGDAGQFLRGLQVVMSRPNQNEVLYTIPGNATPNAATILSLLPAWAEGSAPQVQASAKFRRILQVRIGRKLISGKPKAP